MLKLFKTIRPTRFLSNHHGCKPVIGLTSDLDLDHDDHEEKKNKDKDIVKVKGYFTEIVINLEGTNSNGVFSGLIYSCDNINSKFRESIFDPNDFSICAVVRKRYNIYNYYTFDLEKAICRYRHSFVETGHLYTLQKKDILCKYKYDDITNNNTEQYFELDDNMSWISRKFNNDQNQAV